MKGGSGWVVEIHKTCETELYEGFPDITLAVTLHSLEDFFTLFSLLTHTHIVVSNFSIALTSLQIFFPPI
jgi:hypothetical protein